VAKKYFLPTCISFGLRTSQSATLRFSVLFGFICISTQTQSLLMKSFILAVSGLSRSNILSLYNTGYSLCSICKAGDLLLNLLPAERAICFSFSQFLYNERYDFTFPKAVEMAALRK